MNSKNLSSELLKKYVAGLCDEQERSLVDAWYQGLSMESGESFSSLDEEILFERIQVQISESEPVEDRPVFPLRKFWAYAAAAVVLISIGFTYFSSQKPQKIVAARVTADSSQVIFTNNEKKIIRYNLPDKSTIWLRPGAVVSHPLSFLSKVNREIDFRGEGFFDVTRDVRHPFVIHCGKLKTQVLGTSFNIKANQNEASYKVSVVTGSVSVTTENIGKKAKIIVLKPKEQVEFEKTTNHITVNGSQNSESINENWQSVSLIFNETPMSEVANRLQQTFRIKIEFTNPAIKKCRLKVDFNNQKLPEILGMIDVLLGTKYEIEGEKVILKGDGCGG